jgi:hypothetical protein
VAPAQIPGPAAAVGHADVDGAVGVGIHYRARPAGRRLDEPRDLADLLPGPAELLGQERRRPQPVGLALGQLLAVRALQLLNRKAE